MGNHTVKVGPITIGSGHPLALIAGPCVIETDLSVTFDTAARLKALSEQLQMPLIFKSSFDKANRTAISSYRGPGLKKGLEVLARGEVTQERSWTAPAIVGRRLYVRDQQRIRAFDLGSE